MIAIFSLFVVMIFSLLVVRIATVALTLTGLSRELARFQARSAFTTTGFTSSESERVLQHPVRRRIILLLMLLGNAGMVTAMSSLILSFVNTDPERGLSGTAWFRLAMLGGGLLVLWVVAHSRWIDRNLSIVIAWALKRWTDLELCDYAGLLHLAGDYGVAELSVQADDWLCEKTLAESKLAAEGVLVLGVERVDGTYLGAPRGDTILLPGDTIIVYGSQGTIGELDHRRKTDGNWAHHVAVSRAARTAAAEKAEDVSAHMFPARPPLVPGEGSLTQVESLQEDS